MIFIAFAPTFLQCYGKGCRSVKIIDRNNCMHRKLEQITIDFLQTSVQEAMEDYELRSPQQTMMTACAKTVAGGGTLVAEAGTGTGKTFAYLIPLILSGKKAIIATKTINLQEQLVSKDLRFLASLQRI